MTMYEKFKEHMRTAKIYYPMKRISWGEENSCIIYVDNEEVLNQLANRSIWIKLSLKILKGLGGAKRVSYVRQEEYHDEWYGDYVRPVELKEIVTIYCERPIKIKKIYSSGDDKHSIHRGAYNIETL